MSEHVAKTYAFTIHGQWLISAWLYPDDGFAREDSLQERLLWRSRGIREVEEARWRDAATRARAVARALVADDEQASRALSRCLSRLDRVGGILTEALGRSP